MSRRCCSDGTIVCVVARDGSYFKPSMEVPRSTDLPSTKRPTAAPAFPKQSQLHRCLWDISTCHPGTHTHESTVARRNEPEARLLLHARRAEVRGGQVARRQRSRCEVARRAVDGAIIHNGCYTQQKMRKPVAQPGPKLAP